MSALLNRSTHADALVISGHLEIVEHEGTIACWDDVEQLFQSLEHRPAPCEDRLQWIYRGEGNWGADLQTSLEKLAEQHCIPLASLFDERIEQGLLRRFKREYSRLSTQVPDPNDHVGWLAIMQHHGAPTRLLDITYSIYVALYFALWSYKAGGTAALWCINYDWVTDGWDQLAPKGYFEELDRDVAGEYQQLYRIVLRHRRPKVYAIAPFYFPERLVLQQSGFLLPLDVKKPFMENLGAMPLNPRGRLRTREHARRVVKVSVSLGAKELEEVRYRLLRMNINNATLFPGLDGYARSLRDRLPFQQQREGKSKGFI